MPTLVLMFEKIERDEKIIYGLCSLSSKVEIIINEINVDDVFEFILQLYQIHKDL